jgi:hypothetical protein
MFELTALSAMLIHNGGHDDVRSSGGIWDRVLHCYCGADLPVFNTASAGGPAIEPSTCARRRAAALEMHTPGRQPIVVSTLREGDILDASWLVPPYRWTFDARASELVRALGVNARCLREKCEADHDLGYELMKRFAGAMGERLRATRLQVLDVYGTDR